MLSLKIFGPEGSTSYPLCLNETITIGRSKDCSLRLKCSEVSGSHCSVTLLENHILIKDLDSTNGTFVNNIKIKSQKIFITDCFRIGQNSLEIDNQLVNTRIFNQYKDNHKTQLIKSIDVEGHFTLRKRLLANKRVNKVARKLVRKPVVIKEAEIKEHQADKGSQLTFIVIFLQFLFLFIQDKEILNNIKEENIYYLLTFTILEFMFIRRLVEQRKIAKTIR